MIGFMNNRQRAVHRTMKTVHAEVSHKIVIKGCSISKDVQAYLLNRLVVLALREPVLSDKVKGLYYGCKITGVRLWWVYRS
jgi:hypothetical protein